MVNYVIQIRNTFTNESFHIICRKFASLFSVNIINDWEVNSNEINKSFTLFSCRFID